MFTRFMISKAFKGFSRRAIRIFSRSVIRVPSGCICDGTRCANRRQRVSSLAEVRSRSEADLEHRSPEVHPKAHIDQSVAMSAKGPKAVIRTMLVATHRLCSLDHLVSKQKYRL